MKKRITARTASIILLLFVSFSASAMMTHLGSNNPTPPSMGQSVYGFVDSVFNLEITPPIYGGKGINLDVTDPANLLSFQIAPSAVPMSVAGAVIGNFSLITSDTEKTLIITHTPLILDSDMTKTLDWEMAIGWEINGVHKTAFCLSTSDSVSDASRKISIPLNGEGSDVVRIHDAHIYFRLTSLELVTYAGQYHASVIFEVEGQ